MLAKVRYKDQGASAIAWQSEDDVLEVAFIEPKRAITPGQSVVLYEGDEVLGGGWIQKVGHPLEVLEEASSAN